MSSKGFATSDEDSLSQMEVQQPVKLPRRKILLPWRTTIPPIPAKQGPYPEPTAGPLSEITFNWILPLLSVGYLRKLTVQDLWTVEGTPLDVEQLYDTFEGHLKRRHEAAKDAARAKGTLSEQEIENLPLPKNTVLKALNDTFFWMFWVGGICQCSAMCAQAVTPLLTKRLIAFIEFRTVSHVGIGVGYGIGITLLTLLSTILMNTNFHRSMKTGILARAVLAKAIYQKSLKLSPKARIVYTNGKLSNMVSTDCHRVDFCCQWFHFSWTAPIIFAICVVIVLTNLGVSGLAGIGLLLVSFGIIIVSARFIGRLRGKTNAQTDRRISIMREILNSMKIIKFYAWEDAYLDKVFAVRKKEMGYVRLALGIRNLINSLFVSVSTLAGLVSFVTLSAIGHDLNPAAVFSSLSSFNIVRMPLMILPLSLMTSVEAVLSTNRINDLLSQEEVVDYMIRDDSAEYAIQLSGDYVWEVEEQDANKAERDEKSSAEKVPDEKGYDYDEDEKILDVSAQNEIIDAANNSHGPIVERIESQSEEKSTDVDDNDVNSEKSKDDIFFDGFHNIDFKVKKGEFVTVTGVIGSGKSSFLSAMAGGMIQKSGELVVSGQLTFCSQPWVQNATLRDNITFGKPFDRKWYEQVVDACCLQRDFEILPAGDMTEVGERGITLSGGQKARINLARAVYWNSDVILFDDVLSAVDAQVGKTIIEKCFMQLLAGKTRILATHQLTTLSYSDRTVFIDTNAKIISGTVNEILAVSENFKHLYEYSKDSSEEEEDEEEEEEKQQLEELIKVKTTKDGEEKGKLMQEEDKPEDAVPLKVWLVVFKLGSFLSYAALPLVCFLACLTTFCTLFTNTWLSFWSENRYDKSKGFYIGIFVLLGVWAMVSAFQCFFMLTYLVNKASLKMNMKACRRVLMSPMSFFDTSPLGRILNRFSKDQDTVDNELSDQSRLLFLSFTNVLGTFVLVCVYLPWFAISVVVLAFVFISFAKFYRASAREIKRMDSLARSVVFAQFGETLSGVSTIKGYNSESRFADKMSHAINNMNNAYLLTAVNQRWLTMRLDLIGAALTLVTTMLCVTGQFSISAAASGLVISSLMAVNPMLTMMVREISQVENNMNAVERIYHYAFGLEQEAIYDKPENAPPPEWPEAGHIQLNDVVMSYQPHLPPVLRNLSLDIKPGEKIGICGRTGAGKSSIMIALYRLCELTTGSIVIDDRDISELGLKQLRSKLTIIPQDPIVFEGTVRSNIDPFGMATDVELWDALRRSWLITPEDMELIKSGKANLENLKFHLDQPVNDDGANFSLGERQLLALARALVRNSTILIMDEATSSVDYKTDSQIQSTIAKEFRQCTILCIAHRLRTILNYDRVLVMDAGSVAELDTPLNLFNQNGIFRQMCDQSKITLSDFE